jgi:hypothetical protein
LSESAIRAEVRRMLDACEIDGPPTPVERLLQFRKLSREDMTTQHGGLIRQLFRVTRRVGRKILGLLDVPARFIAVDPELHPKRQSFLTHHEIAHDTLPWHREMLVVTSEWDLSPQVRTIFEAEANRFAGHSIFQIGHMARGYRGRRLEIADLGGLAATYAASLSATARQYVIVQDIPAALLVGKPLGTDGARGIRFFDGLANEAYLREFDPELLEWTLRPAHPLCACVNEPACDSIAVELRIPDRNREERVLLADALYTGHEVLILVHPVRPSRRLFGLSPWGPPGRAA